MTPLRWGGLLVATNRHAHHRPLVETVSAALEGGARGIWLRDKDLPLAHRVALAFSLEALVREAQAMLVVSVSTPDDVQAWWPRGIHGWHEPARWPAKKRPRRTELPGIRGRSCHNVTEVTQAQRDSVAYVTLSPVFASASKPGYGPPLGLTGFAEAVRRTTLPVLALGGVHTSTIGDCRRAGAAGAVVMHEVMAAANPTRSVRALLREWDKAG